MNIFWGVLSLAAAYVWFSFAMGWQQPPGWMVTFAFVILAVDCLIRALLDFCKGSGA